MLEAPCQVTLPVMFNVPIPPSPGERMPAIVVAPPMVPLPPRVAPEATVTLPVAAVWLPVTSSVPPLTVVGPV